MTTGLTDEQLRAIWGEEYERISIASSLDTPRTHWDRAAIAAMRAIAAQARAQALEEAAKIAKRHANIGGDCEARGVMDWETGEVPCDMENRCEICLCGELNQHADKIAADIGALLTKENADG